MTAELHVGGDLKRPHVLVDQDGWEALKAASGPPPLDATLTGIGGNLPGIDVFKGRCPCHADT